MSEFGTICAPPAITPVEAREINRAYQSAFSGDPWNEVSQCADDQAPQRCPGGLSKLAVDTLCDTCELSPLKPAYPGEELTARFNELAQAKPDTAWYLERSDDKLSLAALFWTTDARELADKKYADEPGMRAWLADKLQDEAVIYLDEIFGDANVQAQGKLSNFEELLREIGERYELQKVVFRTIQPRLLAKTRKVFGDSAEIIGPGDGLPDSRGRSFVIIDLGGVAA